MNSACSVSIDLARYHAQQDQMIRDQEDAYAKVARERIEDKASEYLRGAAHDHCGDWMYDCWPFVAEFFSARTTDDREDARVEFFRQLELRAQVSAAIELGLEEYIE